MFKIIMEFPTTESKDRFLGWFLDGGGEYEMNESFCESEETVLSPSQTAKGSWDSITFKEIEDGT